VNHIAIFLARIARGLSRLRGGGGSALPGLIVEKLRPNFLKEILGSLPRGVVVISGTNGKTTTTKITAELLRGAGLKVFTNPTGSNFVRGVISAILSKLKRGRLDADIAVLELDEAHAALFVKQIRPSYALILNVARDQLDRFGEIDTTAKLLEKVAASTTRGVILNWDDPRVLKIAANLPTDLEIQTFGYAPSLTNIFPADDDLYNDEKSEPKKSAKLQKNSVDSREKFRRKFPSVELENYQPGRAEFAIGGKIYHADLRLNGAHNALNAAAALALVRQILAGNFDAEKIVKLLNEIRPAFGRGEKISIGGQHLQLILVKNPGGFRSALMSQYDKNSSVMLAINDAYADGRDVSWLWDVDFSRVKNVAAVGGTRAFDMALRLQYDNVKFGRVETDLVKLLNYFLKENPDWPKQIFCTYTAMLKIRAELKKIARLEPIE
jgi:UDP-N-acetylmuramyl tripeptide synthase